MSNGILPSFVNKAPLPSGSSNSTSATSSGSTKPLPQIPLKQPPPLLASPKTSTTPAKITSTPNGNGAAKQAAPLSKVTQPPIKETSPSSSTKLIPTVSSHNL